MKVLTVNGFSRFMGELSHRQDVEHYALVPQSNLEAVRAEGLAKQAEPFEAKSKIDLQAIKSIRRFIIEVRPDIVHAFYGRPLANTVLALTGIRRPPCVVSYRGISTPPSRFDIGALISYRSRRVSGHACESNAVRSSMISAGIDGANCATVYNYVEPPAAPTGPEVWSEFDIPRNAFIVGTVANVRPVKGIDLLLEAALACQHLTNIYFVVIGKVRHPRVNSLAKDPSIRDRVRLLGFRKDAKQLAGAMDIFVMPSRHEALCQALLESMWHGICPIVSDAGGMKEAIRHEQEGLVIPRNNSQALAAAIEQLYEDSALRERFGAAARHRVAQEFTPEKMADRVIGLYQTIVNRAACQQSLCASQIGTAD